MERNGWGNQMNPSTETFVARMAPKVFYNALQKFTTVEDEGERPGDKNAIYNHAERVVNVISTLISIVDTHIRVADCSKTFSLFAYSTSSDPVLVNRIDVFLIAWVVEHVVEDNDCEKDIIDDEDKEAEKPPEIAQSILYIGSTNL